MSIAKYRLDHLFDLTVELKDLIKTPSKDSTYFNLNYVKFDLDTDE